MTPGERKYDVDLVRAMRDMAKWVGRRSGKIALTLMQGADRIERLSNSIPVVEPLSQPELQPASTPALPEAVRENGRG